MTGFDAEAFMNSTTDSPMATQMESVPEGEYLARVGAEPDDLKLDSIQGKKDTSKSYFRLTMLWDIIDENAKASLGRDKIRVRDQFFVDFENGLLAVGKDKNVTLGNRREALGLNDAGPFNLNQLRGAGPAMIKVKHTTNEGRTYANVDRVVKLS